MTKYLIKTDTEERKTHIIKLQSPIERIGLVYTDFIVRPDTRDISREEIVNPQINKSIGHVNLHKKEGLVSVTFEGREIATINRDGGYKEDSKEVPIRRYNSTDLSSDKYARLKQMGLTHAYSLGEESSLAYVFCFARNGGLASIAISREEKEGTNIALKGLALSIATRVEEQDYLFDFLR